jgi:hypothetical protein
MTAQSSSESPAAAICKRGIARTPLTNAENERLTNMTLKSSMKWFTRVTGDPQIAYGS